MLAFGHVFEIGILRQILPVFLHLVLLVLRFAHFIHFEGQVLFTHLTLKQLDSLFEEEECLVGMCLAVLVVVEDVANFFDNFTVFRIFSVHMFIGNSCMVKVLLLVE